ncbi:MAG TPA: DUF1905 domain-containing protein [Actinomycetales bacterium]|nr:DUF1905 domain-containing protein [Actinomycetales bacterium]
MGDRHLGGAASVGGAPAGAVLAQLDFAGEVWHWRGPAPFYFVTVPEEESEIVHEVRHLVTYGWGMVPLEARVGRTTWTTSLFPKDGLYVLPMKDAVRRAEEIEEGDVIDVSVVLRERR